MQLPTSVTRIDLIAATLALLGLPTVTPVEAQEKLTLKATPETVAWGYYDAKAAPVLRIKSGDTVENEALIMSSRKT